MARMIDAENTMGRLLYGDAYISEELAEYIKQVFDEQPTIEAEPVKHGKWIHIDKHFFEKEEDGCVNEWAWEAGFHNGVSCEVCGKSICIHCNPDWENDKCNDGHYICSECGSHEKEKRDYCPNCGARMDKEAANHEV